MEDDELAAIRQKRMQELQQQQGSGKDAQAAQKQQQEMMINSILSQILDQNARARLNNIAMVKPEKAKRFEAMLIQMAQSGRISEKMTEQQLVKLLEQFSDKQQKTTVKFQRRNVMDSDSD